MDEEAAIDAPLRALSAALGLPPLALRAEVDAVLAQLATARAQHQQREEELLERIAQLTARPGHTPGCGVWGG